MSASPPTEPGSFRKKPVVIQARRIASTSFDELQAAVAWIGDGKKAYHNGAAVYIYTAEGTMQALPGDWIIRGVKGEYYPCKPDIFAQTYESAEQPHEPGVAQSAGARYAIERMRTKTNYNIELTHGEVTAVLEELDRLNPTAEPSGNGKPPLCYVMRNKFDSNQVHQFMEHSWELLVVPQQPETKAER